MAPNAVRLAEAADIDGIAENNIAMAMETEKLELPKETISKGVAALVNDSSKGLYFVIPGDSPGSVIGQLMITYEWSDWRNQNCWWIQSVYVHPDHRKQGLFRSLFDCAREEAQKVQACGLRLYADNSNDPAMDTYRRMGMTSHYSVFELMFGSY